MACNLTDWEDGFLNGKRYLIDDRDTKFCAKFLDVLAGSDIKSIKLPRRSPNLNAHAERFVLSLKEECLDRMIFIGEQSGELETQLRKVSTYFTEEANHAVAIATRVMTVAISLLVALVVGYIVVSFYLAYFGMLGDILDGI